METNKLPASSLLAEENAAQGVKRGAEQHDAILTQNRLSRLFSSAPAICAELFFGQPGRGN